MNNFMTDYERDMLDCKQELAKLALELRNCEKWMEYAKATKEEVQSKLFDLETKHGKQ